MTSDDKPTLTCEKCRLEFSGYGHNCKPYISHGINVIDCTEHKRMPNPTEKDLNGPLFNKIWNAIKSWDLSVPEYYNGYCGANGSRVMLIINALTTNPEPAADLGAFDEAAAEIAANKLCDQNHAYFEKGAAWQHSQDAAALAQMKALLSAREELQTIDFNKRVDAEAEMDKLKAENNKLREQVKDYEQALVMLHERVGRCAYSDTHQWGNVMETVYVTSREVLKKWGGV